MLDLKKYMMFFAGAGSAQELPIQNNVLAWYNFGDPTKFIEGQSAIDTAGWVDSSGNGYDMDQSVLANRFTYNSLGGYIEGDGTKFLEIASRFGLGANPDLTVIAKVRYRANAQETGYFQIGGVSSGQSNVLRFTEQSDKFSASYNGGNERYGTITYDQDYVVAIRRASGDTFDGAECIVDKVESLPTSSTNPTGVPTNTDAEACIGSVTEAGTGKYFDGRIYEIQVYNAKLTDQQISDLTDYINGV